MKYLKTKTGVLQQYQLCKCVTNTSLVVWKRLKSATLHYTVTAAEGKHCTSGFPLSWLQKFPGPQKHFPRTMSYTSDVQI